jgi:hypothetical protein
LAVDDWSVTVSIRAVIYTCTYIVYLIPSLLWIACPLETYKSTAGNEMCSPCPQNSDATSVGSEICSCQPNYMRPNSNAAEDCSGKLLWS